MHNTIARAKDILENEYIKVTVNQNGTFDLTDKENGKTQKTDLSFGKEIKKAYIINLNEERISELPVNETSVSLTAEKSKIFTVEIEF